MSQSSTSAIYSKKADSNWAALLGLSRISAPVITETPPAGFEYLAYCDGACQGNGRDNAPGGWGFALVGVTGLSLMGRGGERGTTNNRMEMTAAIELLRQLPPGVKVLVQTDSQYVIKGCGEWRAGWARRGMKNSKGEAVANPELWRMLWAEADARKVTWKWVKGHSGHPGNDLVDCLAVSGIPARA